jgi:hypothetical protein
MITYRYRCGAPQRLTASFCEMCSRYYKAGIFSDDQIRSGPIATCIALMRAGF